MAEPTPGRHSIMDWRAALWAGIIAGAAFLIVELTLTPILTSGTPWSSFQFTAAILLGETVSAGANGVVLAAALALHFVLAIFYACLLAFILHRWGLVVGIVGGALFGLAFYTINYYSLSQLFPWFFPIRSWTALGNHILFGALAGGIYELLERDVDDYVEPAIAIREDFS